MDNRPSQSTSRPRWYASATAFYLSILLGSGFVLGLNRLSTAAWAFDYTLLSNSANLAQLLCFLFVTLSVVGSAIGVMDSTAVRPICSESRFMVTIGIMFVYLVEFSYFLEVEFVLILAAITWWLFVWWDLLKSREQTGPGTNTPSQYPSRRDSWSILWAFLFLPLPFVYGWSNDPLLSIATLVIAIGLTIGYRVLKAGGRGTQTGGASQTARDASAPP